MKKIMILGVGAAQLNLIREAKSLGYHVAVCDMRAESEGAKLADSFYPVNYMNREEILKAAEREQIDGVISNSEPAMLNVAWLSQRLGLPGNTEESVQTLLSKEKFRALQKKVGVFAPAHFVADSPESLLNRARSMKYPVIVKPTESSGTRGTARFDAYCELNMTSAYRICADFSRNGLVTIEEYVRMNNLRVNDADVFVLGGEFLWDGWLWEDRSPDAPMLPMTEIYPMALPDERKAEIRATVEKILKGSGVRHGEYNVETYYTEDNQVFVIEINPRQAGNYIPQLIEQHTGVSLTRLLVSTAVNDMCYYEELKTYERQYNFVTLQVVFSKRDGIFKELYLAPEIKQYVKWVDCCVHVGEKVVRGKNASEAVAYVNMQFDSYETQHHFTDRIEEYVYPLLSD